MTPDQEVRQFLGSGDRDVLASDWPGDNVMSRVEAAERAMKQALIAEVRRRAKGGHLPRLPPGLDPSRFAIGKVAPMVRGLFPSREQEAVFRVFEGSLKFVTRGNIERVLIQMHSLETAWTIGNLYLGSLGLPGLDDKPVRLVGLSEETSFFVSMAYFEEKDPFADYVVHEAAHVFHNWKREWAGLRHTRRQEFLLPIAFAKRETFAFACEAYSRILEQAKSRAERLRLHATYAAAYIPDCDGVDRYELADILAEALAARNGWKRILRRCSPPQCSSGQAEKGQELLAGSPTGRTEYASERTARGDPEERNQSHGRGCQESDPGHVSGAAHLESAQCGRASGRR